MSNLTFVLETLSCNDLSELLKQSIYSDVCDTVKEFNITGKDLLNLREFHIQLKLGNKINKMQLHRFHSLIQDVQSDPKKLFESIPYSSSNDTASEVKHKLVTQKKSSQLTFEAYGKSSVCGENTSLLKEVDIAQPKQNMITSYSKDAVRHRNDSESSQNYEPPPFTRKFLSHASSTGNYETYNNISAETDQQCGGYHKLPDISYAKPKIEYKVNDGYLEPTNLKTSSFDRHKFYRRVDRSEGKKMLEDTRKGSFLLRPSGEEGFLGVLMINGNLKIQNVPIWYNKGTEKFYLDSHGILSELFTSIDELLEHYSNNEINGDFLLKQTDNQVREWLK